MKTKVSRVTERLAVADRFSANAAIHSGKSCTTSDERRCHRRRRAEEGREGRCGRERGGGPKGRGWGSRVRCETREIDKESKDSEQ